MYEAGTYRYVTGGSYVTVSPLMVVSRGTKNRAGNGCWNLAEIRRPATKLTTLTLDRVV